MVVRRLASDRPVNCGSWIRIQGFMLVRYWYNSMTDFHVFFLCFFGKVKLYHKFSKFALTFENCRNHFRWNARYHVLHYPSLLFGYHWLYIGNCVRRWIEAEPWSRNTWYSAQRWARPILNWRNPPSYPHQKNIPIDGYKRKMIQAKYKSITSKQPTKQTTTNRTTNTNVLEKARDVERNEEKVA